MNRINTVITFVLSKCDNLGQEEATGGEFQGSIVGLFGGRQTVWFDVFGKRLARLTCCRAGVSICSPNSHELCILRALFYGNGGTGLERLGVGGFETSDDDRRRTWMGRWASCTNIFDDRQ